MEIGAAETSLEVSPCPRFRFHAGGFGLSLEFFFGGPGFPGFAVGCIFPAELNLLDLTVGNRSSGALHAPINREDFDVGGIGMGARVHPVEQVALDGFAVTEPKPHIAAIVERQFDRLGQLLLRSRSEPPGL